MKRIKKPFTLVELLCVIIVLALLAALSIKITQVAYRRADTTRTNAILEAVRAGNEQYKVKHGYYFPHGGEARDGSWYQIPLYSKNTAGDIAQDSGARELLGDAYETCLAAALAEGKTVLLDAWGTTIRYRSPGIYNTSSFDLYSVGPDKGVGNQSDNNKKKPGLGDDIANFKNPDA